MAVGPDVCVTNTLWVAGSSAQRTESPAPLRLHVVECTWAGEEQEENVRGREQDRDLGTLKGAPRASPLSSKPSLLPSPASFQDTPSSPEWTETPHESPVPTESLRVAAPAPAGMGARQASSLLGVKCSTSD